MDEITRTNRDNPTSEDKGLQNTAFFCVIEESDSPVEWAYEVWDQMVTDLSHEGFDVPFNEMGQSIRLPRLYAVYLAWLALCPCLLSRCRVFQHSHEGG